MGLDQYIFKITKAELEECDYKADELREMRLNFISLKEAHDNMDLYSQLLPYTIQRNVSDEFINTEKIIEDYNLPKESYIGMMSYEKIVVRGKNDNGEYVEQEIYREEIDKKYTITKTEPYYIWKSEEVAYWRKYYDLQDWIYETIDGVDNTGYYILDAETIMELNRKFKTYLAVQEPTDKFALFYWEWY